MKIDKEKLPEDLLSKVDIEKLRRNMQDTSQLKPKKKNFEEDSNDTDSIKNDDIILDGNFFYSVIY